MADIQEKYSYGRKIFFFLPHYSVRNEVISYLQTNEYEVYIIDDYRDIKNLIRRNPGAILFLNVDGTLPVSAWFNFIRSFEREEILCQSYISVLTDRMKKDEVDLFNRAAHLPGKVLTFDDGIEVLRDNILAILEETNAKGSRQYVRANVNYDKDAALFWNHGSKMHQLKLLDISSVGMAVKVPPMLENQIIVQNYVLYDVTMRLGSKQMVINAVVYSIRSTPESTIWILLLLDSTSNAVKNEIRSYVSQSIQKEMVVSINNDYQDNTDYNALNYYNLSTKSKPVGQTFNPFATIPGYNN